jgi:uncharacterized protein YjiS (DUF1127 family)
MTGGLSVIAAFHPFEPNRTIAPTQTDLVEENNSLLVRLVEWVKHKRWQRRLACLSEVELRDMGLRLVDTNYVAMKAAFETRIALGL